ncbi:hypothetical protein LTR36_008904 [Oleoguttula mirabilis]|uniref:Uncharacterized protein n=1 Tax=Oleoguttula mirabilis TaxID=1507867 RepID=A0AAV9J7R9_9PEZI|nr:hypothetical protein LTR36_008904 [Oleoguttula mirabilis]
MLESHRRQVADIEQAVGRLHADMGNVVAALNEVRGELRARPLHVEQSRHDSGDLEVLAGQVANVTNKANEVDGLKMQIELMKNRIKRFEEQGSPSALFHRPGTSSTHRELYEGPAPHPVPQQHLPSMRPASVMSTPSERPPGMQAPPILASQGSATFQPSTESRTLSREYSSSQSAAPGFRPVEPLPPPSTFSSWRPAESRPPSSIPPPPPLSQAFRPHAMEPDAQTSGWAAVNVNQPTKRPFDEQRPSPYDNTSAPGSPKRPRLAPIMPRGSYSDESFIPTPSSMQQSAATATPDGMFRPRDRMPSDPSQSQSQSLPTPASANTNAYRFITSTAQADSQESWRPHDEHMHHDHHPPGPPGPPGRGRGRGRGGRGRGRGGGGGSRGGPHHHHPPHPPHDHHDHHHHHHEHHLHEAEKIGTPDWEKSDWTRSQISPDGYYNPTHPQRGGLVRRSGGAAGGPSDREHEYPVTPVHGQHDPFGMQVDDSANKKSRTKPIRNAEGILIRKDGRPDMRSVSSANNLRKVHAKKEAERVEMEGRTPTSARSLAPAHSNSMSDEERENTRSGTPVSASAADGDDQDTQERHQELMSRIFPHGYDGAGGRNLAGNYFPRRDEQPTSAPEIAMKTEEQDDEEQPGVEGAGVADEGRTEDSQMTGVVAHDMSEAQPDERATEHHALVQRQQAQEEDVAPKQERTNSGESTVPSETPAIEPQPQHQHDS